MFVPCESKELEAKGKDLGEENPKWKNGSGRKMLSYDEHIQTLNALHLYNGKENILKL